MGDVARALEEIRQKVEEQALQLDYAQKLQEVADKVSALKAVVDEKWTYFKIAVAIGSVILTVGGTIAGLVGFHTVQDAKQRLTDKINQNISETSEFYGDVMASSVLYSQGRYEDATPKLMRWFNNGHTYDKNILMPLLSSMNIRDNWDEAKPVIQTLRSDPKKFDEINDASIYTIIGSIEVQLGMTELGPDNAGDGEKEMQLGNKLLERAYYLAGPNQNDIRRNILMNEWLYHVARGEFDQSQQNVLSLKSLPSGTHVYSWDSVSSWLCMAALARRDHANTMRIAEQQWKQLRSSYFPARN
jgi:hypothetical protein